MIDKVQGGLNRREDITSARIICASHKLMLVAQDSLGQNVLKILDKVCPVLTCLAALPPKSFETAEYSSNF